MIENIKISKAGFEDLEHILELQKIAFISEAELYNNYSIEPLTQTLDSIKDDFNTYIFLKAEMGNKIVGSVKGRETGEFCWIGRLIVSPEFQNKGIGRKLMTEIEKEFPATSQYMLSTGYKSIKNITLYESLGYKRNEVFVGDGIHMVKMIKDNRKK